MKFFFIKISLLIFFSLGSEFIYHAPRLTQGLICDNKTQYNDFYEQLAFCSQKYFSTLMIKNNHGFYLTYDQDSFCQITAYQFNNRQLYFCSEKKDFFTSSFNQLLSTLDSPLMREYCAKQSYCNYQFLSH